MGGEQLPNKGGEHAQLMTDEGERTRATFQVAEVTRPLCSVPQVCDQDNKVVFKTGRGYMEGLASGKRSYFQRPRNVHLKNMHVLVGDDDKEHSAGVAWQGP